MHLSHISLVNFRNYVRLELDLPPHTSVIRGLNSQGKTNLLEAVYFLATTRSPRASADRELINWLSLEEEMPFMRAACDLERSGRSLRLEVTMMLRAADNGFERAGSAVPAVAKRIRVNNLAKRAADLLGQLNVVLFTPQDIDLVAGAPAGRRRYMDVANCQVDHQYLQSLQRYVKVLSHRNHLLRLIRDRRASPDELVFWDEQLITAGSHIVMQRYRSIGALGELAARRLGELTGGRERLHVQYVSSLAGQRDQAFTQRWRVRNGLSAEDDPLMQSALANDVDLVRSAFRGELGIAQPREIAQGASLVGPHRDDLHYLLDGHDAALFGSRGQQRLVALSMRLAEAEYMRVTTGERPLLLLDDVLSELDETRRRLALGCIDPEQQVLITTTSIDDYRTEIGADAAIFEVNQGQICAGCPN